MTNMPIDPGWFYSTLPQVAAAIVGLLGAVFGNRLIEHLQTMRQERNELDSRIHDTQASGCMHTVDRWSKYRDFLIQEIDADKEAIKK